jgi:hypothetical protein
VGVGAGSRCILGERDSLRLALRLRIDARVAAQSPLSGLYFHLESAETSGSGSACVP